MGGGGGNGADRRQGEGAQSGPDARSEIMRRAAPYLGLGTTFLVSIGAGIAAGYWLDRKLETEPWLTLAGALLGLVTGFYNFFVVVTRRPPE